MLLKYGLLLASIAPLWAGTVQLKRAIKIFPPDATFGGLPEFFKELRKGVSAKPSDFALSAEVSLKQDETLVARDSIALEWQPLKSDEGAISFGLPKGDPRSAVPLRDFDELWIDYEDPQGAPSSIVAWLDLERRGIASPGQKTQITAIAKGTVGRPVEEINAADAEWVPKTRSYSLGRILGVGYDDRWRYVKWSRFAVVQRRLHRSLDGIEYLDFVFAPGTKPDSINLRIATSDDNSQGQLFELGKTPSTAFDSSGRLVRRVDIASLLPDRAATRTRFYLQEVIVLMKEDVDEVARVKPLQKIVFQAANSAPGDRESARTLPTRSEHPNCPVKRLVVDLDMKFRNTIDLKRGRLTLTPNEGKPVERRIREIRLVSLGETKLPSFLVAAEQVNRAWGGPFLYRPFGNEQIEWPVVLGSFSFEKQRASWRSDRPISRRPKKGGLFLSGEGRWVEVDLPFSPALESSSRFLLNVPEWPNRIKTAELLADSKHGPVRFQVEPNQSRPIPPVGRLTRLRLRLSFEKPFHIKLQDVVVFRPTVIEKEDAFDRKLPIISGRPLKSPRQMLEDWEPLRSGTTPISLFFPTSMQKVVHGPVLAPGDPAALPGLVDSDGAIHLGQSPWFQINHVILTPVSRLPNEFWWKAAQGLSRPRESMKPMLARLAALSLLACAAWVLKRKLGLAKIWTSAAKGVRLPNIPQDRRMRAAAIAWTASTALLFLIFWLLPSVSFDNLFALSGLSAALVIRHAFQLPALRARLPKAALAALSAPAGPYFLTAAALLAAIATSAALQIPILPEYLGVGAFGCLILAVVLDTESLKRPPSV